MGRPRTVIPDIEEMEKLGEEMINWVIENEPLHLSQWWSGEKFITRSVWDSMCQAKEFIPYYERAILLIGKAYLDKDSPVRDNISSRWQRVYFRDLRQVEDEDKVFESKLKRQENEVSAETLASLLKNPSDIIQK